MSTSWFRSLRKNDRAALRQQERRRRFQIESLEGRQVLSTFSVTSLADSGPGSLRAAIVASDATPATTNTPNSIVFDFNTLSGGNGDQQVTINLNSALPTITQPVHLLGTLPNATPGVVLNGANAGYSAVGLQLTSSAAGSEVEGFVVDSFGSGGILVDGAHDQISGDFIGVNGAGTAAAGNGAYGVRLTSNATGSIVEGSTISASSYGVEIDGTTGALVTADNIGTDSTGTHALANNIGVVVFDGATNNTISSDLISGNTLYGVEIYGSGTTGNIVEGNDIGTDRTGAVALGNGNIGLFIANSATNNTVGGIVAGSANVISGNGVYGVYISDAGTTGNVVEGNFIGTNPGGTTALGTDGRSLGNDDGVEIAYGASGNIVGGTTSAASNIISGNLGDGVQITSTGGGNLVEGNFIGTAAGGTSALPNGRNGVTIQYGTNHDIIGGITPGAGNVISGNSNYGVWILNANDATVEGNLIGMNASGSGGLANLSGVWIEGGSANNTIGGNTTAARNVISGNTQWGVYITGSGTNGNVVEGDFVGTDITGIDSVPNGYNGVDITSGAQYNTIGGTTAATRNIISGNSNNGVVIAFAGASYNTVEGNWIGLNAAGNDLANGANGVEILGGATSNTIGGTANVISANAQQGVLITDSGTTNNIVSGDLIGTDPTGRLAQDSFNHSFGNVGHGVVITNGAQYNLIGGTTAATRNVISNNVNNGVAFSGSGTAYNLVEGDFIGTNVDGTASLGNGGNGVFFSGAPGNTVGGTTAATRNIISGNQSNGLWLTSGASSEVIEGNFIGTDVSGTYAVPNRNDGVLINAASTNNIIGGTDTGAGNVISGNLNAGVTFSDSGTAYNAVYGNFIGTDITGNAALGNHYGVQLFYGASSNTIGTSSGRNVISGNGWDGVQLFYGGTSNNTVQYDNIGTNANGSDALANGGSGVAIAGSANNNFVQYSLISGNAYDGVFISDPGTISNTVYLDDIGTGPGGFGAVSNGTNGVVIQSYASSNSVEYSTISGNLEDGVLVQGYGTNNNAVNFNNIGINAGVSGVVLPTGRPYSNFIGVEVSNNANGTDVVGNNISGNAVGVQLDGAATGTSVLYNAIGTVTYSVGGGTFGNTQYDVYVIGSSGNNIDYNTIANAGVVGILFQGSPNQDGGHNTFINNRTNEQS